MSDIGKLIVDALIARITADCQAAIDPADPTRVTLVKRGEFQDDPEDYGVVVCVHRNDPDRTERAGQSGWPDELDLREMGLIIGEGYTAGSEFWKRRFSVEIIVWPGVDQDSADQINGVVTARVRRAVSRLFLTDLVDDFGERMVVGSNPLRRMKVDEGGGPDDEYSWRAFLYLEYTTLWNP